MNAIKEDWKWVEGYENRYMISNLGRLQSHVKFGRDPVIRTWQKHSGGYQQMVLYSSTGKTRNKFAHRLVAEAFIDNPDSLPQVGHRNDSDKTDNRASELYWCSEGQNIRDAHSNGVMRKSGGSTNKVSDEVVKAMFLEVASGAEISQIAKLYGVPRTTLSSIVNKRSRTNVTDQL